MLRAENAEVRANWATALECASAGAMGRTTLMQAAVHGDHRLVQELCASYQAYGLSWVLDAVDDEGCSALMLAAEHGQLQALQKLLDCRAATTIQKARVRSKKTRTVQPPASLQSDATGADGFRASHAAIALLHGVRLWLCTYRHRHQRCQDIGSMIAMWIALMCKATLIRRMDSPHDGYGGGPC